ncbi:MAG: HD domain-containing protein, partial [Kiritimatiellia bacterium]|nr:HD domain-containing protein [Kiritimatiellia bacterium]
MNLQEEKSLSTWFEEYVHQFTGPDGDLPAMLKLKLDHSRRVAANTADIGQDLGFDAGDTRTAIILGLFHDIGRFTQFVNHQTFRDEHSFDHGLRGAE